MSHLFAPESESRCKHTQKSLFLLTRTDVRATPFCIPNQPNQPGFHSAKFRTKTESANTSRFESPLQVWAKPLFVLKFVPNFIRKFVPDIVLKFVLNFVLRIILNFVLRIILNFVPYFVLNSNSKFIRNFVLKFIPNFDLKFVPNFVLKFPFNSVLNFILNFFCISFWNLF